MNLSSGRQRTVFVALTFALLSTTSIANAQQNTLPDDFDQLIQTKTGLLEQYSQLSQDDEADKAFEVLRQIINIHRKALRVGIEVNRSAEDIGQLQGVFINDGDFFSDQLFERGEFAATAALRKEIADLQESLTGPDHPETQKLRSKAGTAQKLADASKELQVSYQVAVSSRPQAIQATQNGKPDVAAIIYRKIIDAEVAVFGEVHSDIAVDLNQLGRAELSQQNYAAAEATFKQGLKVREAATGKDLQYATMAFNLGLTYQRSQRFAAAEEQYLAAAAIEEPILGSTNESFKQTLSQLGALYQQSGDTEKLTALQQRLAASDPLNTVLSHLPRGTLAATMIEPSKLMETPGLEMLPFEIIKASGETEFGFNPLEVDAAVAFATLPIGDPAHFGVSFRMKDGAQTNFPWDQNSETVEFQGQQYLRETSGAALPMCAAKFDDGAVVVGTEEAIRQCLANSEESSVVRLLKADRGRGQLAGATDIVVMRPILEAAMSEAPPVPPALENLKTLPQHIDSLQVRLDVSGKFNVSIALNAASADAAQTAATIIKEALDFGLRMGLQEAQSSLQGDEPVKVATRDYFERIATQYIGKLKPTVTDNTVNLQIDASQHAFGPVAVALLLPAIQQAREAARRTQDKNSLKLIALAMHNYHDVFGHFPAQANFDANGQPLLSWRVHLLPYLEQTALYEQFRLNEPWDSEHNLPLSTQMPSVYRNSTLDDDTLTTTLSFGGTGTFMEGREGQKMRSFTDGTSNTLMVAEANPEQAVVWTQPADITFDSENPMAGLGLSRPGGFQAALTDGSVHFISVDVDPANLRRLIIRNDGEVVDPF